MNIYTSLTSYVFLTVMGYQRLIKLIGLLVTFWCLPSFAAGFYSWTDKQGNVHYGDQVPPSDSQEGHKVIDREGIVVDQIAPRKTDAQLSQERQQRRVEEERQRRMREQQIRDTTLLNTFSSVEELDRIRDQRIDTLDSLIALGRKKVGKLTDKLADAEARRDQLESAGQSVPFQLKENINVLKQQTTHSENKISEYHLKRVEIQNKFQQDRARFVELTKGQ